MKEVFLEGEPVKELQEAHSELYTNVYDDTKRVIKYTTNHDVNLTDGTPQELFGGNYGSVAAASLSFRKTIISLYSCSIHSHFGGRGKLRPFSYLVLN